MVITALMSANDEVKYEFYSLIVLEGRIFVLCFTVDPFQQEFTISQESWLEQGAEMRSD